MTSTAFRGPAVEAVKVTPPDRPDRALEINAGTWGDCGTGITPAAVTYCGRWVAPHLTAALTAA